MKATDEQGRGKPNNTRPWCWCEKATLTMITETFSESNQSASARSVYLALCQLASDNQSDTFTESKALIAHKSGVSPSTVARLLKIFEQLPVLHVERNFVNGVKISSTYTLLPISHSDLSIGHRLQQGFNPDKDKESGRIKKESDDKSTRTATTASSSSDLVSDLKEAEKHPHWKKFKAFCASRDGLPNPKGFKTWLKSQPPPKPKPCKSSSNGANPRYEALLRASEAKHDREAGITQ
jgi:hypothetical protein